VTVQVDDLGDVDGPMIRGGVEEPFLVHPDRFHSLESLVIFDVRIGEYSGRLVGGALFSSQLGEPAKTSDPYSCTGQRLVVGVCSLRGLLVGLDCLQVLPARLGEAEGQGRRQHRSQPQSGDCLGEPDGVDGERSHQQPCCRSQHGKDR
jgi:hypothetical protein